MATTDGTVKSKGSPARTGLLVLGVLLAAVTAAMVVLVTFVVRRTKKKKEDLWAESVVASDTPRNAFAVVLKDTLQGANCKDPTKWHYAMGLKVERFEQEQYPVVLFARGPRDGRIKDMQLIAVLAPGSNDMYIGFRKAVPSKEQASLYFSRDSPTLLELTQHFCLFRVETVPFYRFFTMDVLFDYNANKALLFMDGEVVKQFNVRDCDASLEKHDGGGAYGGFYLLSSDMTFNATTLKKYEATEYRHVFVQNRVPRVSDVSAGAKGTLAELAKIEKRELDTKVKCQVDAAAA